MTEQSLSTLLVVGAFAVLPVVLMAATSFVKISVVFSVLRNALGTGQVPSGLIIAALAAVLTLYVMAPVGSAMFHAAAPQLSKVNWNQPLKGASKAALSQAWEKGKSPLQSFLGANANTKEKKLFLDLAKKRIKDTKVQAKDMLVVFPAFMLTELAEAFLIAFLIFIPFLIIDLVVSNFALSLGMQMLSPTVVSLPFKLLLFVAVDGWYLLSRALISGYI